MKNIKEVYINPKYTVRLESKTEYKEKKKKKALGKWPLHNSEGKKKKNKKKACGKLPLHESELTLVQQ